MRWVVVLLLSGCSSILGIDDFKLGDAGSKDGDADTGYCLGPVGWKVCVAAMPTNTFAVTSTTNISTKDFGMCAPMQPATWKAAGHPDACFVIAAQINISAAFSATGDMVINRPLVLVAADTITITAPIDVASHGGTTQVIGPGAPGATCGTPPAPMNGAAGGGGAGGSFMRKGGNGGASSATGGMQTAAAPMDSQSPTVLHGGCNGAAGGNSTTDMGGVSGKGGGAIYLLAGNRIMLSSFINASGSGGGGSGRTAGGGGGGSGGMIVLHAPMITGNGGVLIANGGGGGGGGTANLGGSPGADPVPNMPSGIALGGNGGSGGGGGGAGFAGTADAVRGNDGTPTTAAGGGGGGGGAGYIRTNNTPMQVTASPPISIVQN